MVTYCNVVSFFDRQMLCLIATVYENATAKIQENKVQIPCTAPLSEHNYELFDVSVSIITIVAVIVVIGMFASSPSVTGFTVFSWF